MLLSVFHSLLSCLMIVTLLWGGCISCPQFFMLSAAKKSCCEKDGSCKRPAPAKERSSPTKECQRMPLEPAAFATHHVEQPAIRSLPVPVLTPAALPVPVSFPTPEYSPPDLNVLHSTFLV